MLRYFASCMVFFKSYHNNVEIRYHNVQGGTGRFHKQGNELTLLYLYFHPLIYSMGCATENNQLVPES